MGVFADINPINEKCEIIFDYDIICPHNELTKGRE